MSGGKSSKPNPEVHGPRENNSTYVSPSPSYFPSQSLKPHIGTTSLGDQQAAMSAVFSEIIRAKVVKLLQTGNLWPQPTSQSCGPVVPPVAPRGQDSITTMGNLGALLSLLGAQHQ
jgi:hypothetical protein